MKHQLRAKYYIRYVDDFVILHRDRSVLEDHERQIADFLQTLKLELHPQKSKIYPLHKGATLLGYRIFYHYKLLRKSSIRKMRRKLSNVNHAEIDKALAGWNGYAMWANAYKLRKRLLSEPF